MKNFTKTNLEKIENNWDNITSNIAMTVQLMHKFGFNDKSLVAKIALLPISFYLSKLNPKNFIDSTDMNDVRNQNIIQKWLINAMLKNAFSSSSDNILKKPSRNN